VVQEALTNTRKHSRARRVSVRIDCSGTTATLAIEDDGVGFDPARVRGRGLGLIGIQERIMELGGSLVIRSRPGKGTVLSAKIPAPQEILTSEYSNSVGR
jgi:signal transduction histidine kinase